MSFCLWLMGPTSCGKTTLAEVLLHNMRKKNYPVMHFDGDEIRDMFGQSLGFEQEDRLRVVKALVYFANKTTEAGINVIVSALTANRDARQHVFTSVSHLIVGYIQCSIETCARRDPKGLYKKAKNAEIDTLIGFNSDYLPPERYNFIINSDKYDIDQSVSLIEHYFNTNKIIQL